MWPLLVSYHIRNKSRGHNRRACIFSVWKAFLGTEVTQFIHTHRSRLEKSFKPSCLSPFVPLPSCHTVALCTAGENTAAVGKNSFSLPFLSCFFFSHLVTEGPNLTRHQQTCTDFLSCACLLWHEGNCSTCAWHLICDHKILASLVKRSSAGFLFVLRAQWHLIEGRQKKKRKSEDVALHLVCGA